MLTLACRLLEIKAVVRIDKNRILKKSKSVLFQFFFQKLFWEVLQKYIAFLGGATKIYK